MTIWQARRSVVAGLKAVYADYLNVDVDSIRFTLDTVDFDGAIDEKGREHFTVDLKSVPPVFPKRHWNGNYLIKDEAGGDRMIPRPLNKIIFVGKDRAADAALLAGGLNRLRILAMERQVARKEFPQQAAACRAMDAKPPIPEEGRVQRLLAENAVREKKPREALVHYETGLGLYPTWPQGYFNAALIAAELGYFDEAVEHVQSYMELVPDAPDAESARDQILIWQEKVKQPVKN